jgi:hypothetical protein
MVPLVIGLHEYGDEAAWDSTLIWAASGDQVVGAVFPGTVNDGLRAPLSLEGCRWQWATLPGGVFLVQFGERISHLGKVADVVSKEVAETKEIVEQWLVESFFGLRVAYWLWVGCQSW